MQIATKRDFDELKASCSTKAKAYVSIVWVKEKLTQSHMDTLNAIRKLKVNQKTPVRVLHRRSQMVREKFIYGLRANLINEHYMELYVIASAGTYIKEFVHGDLGRTVPSIGEILKTEADILQLDVADVFDNIGSVDLDNPLLYRVSCGSDSMN